MVVMGRVVVEIQHRAPVAAQHRLHADVERSISREIPRDEASIPPEDPVQVERQPLAVPARLIDVRARRNDDLRFPERAERPQIGERSVESLERRRIRSERVLLAARPVRRDRGASAW